MVKPEVLASKLAQTDEYLGFLQQAQRYSLEEFLSNPERYGAAERFLQLTIETLNDAGNHIVADNGLGPVEWQRDIVAHLVANKIVTPELGETWKQIIGFRNLLVHQYGKIDRKRVHAVLQNNLQDLISIRTALSVLL
jgi:uncharacterized protein YutE (UPF0331/DUF86 family)